MKRAAIYLRVSSDRQAREGDSIPAQRVYRHAMEDKVAGMEQRAVDALQFSLQF